MLAIQNTCGTSCCRDGAEGDVAFAWASRSHNYASDVGPGPWVVANLSEFDRGGTVNYGPGEFDVYPCPMHPAARDFYNRAQRMPSPSNNDILARWGSPGFTCDPSTCTSAPHYPNEHYGCYRCDEVARVSYVFAQETADPSLHRRLSVYDTRQRWETDSYAACFYLATVYIHLDSLPGPVCAPPSPPPSPWGGHPVAWLRSRLRGCHDLATLLEELDALDHEYAPHRAEPRKLCVFAVQLPTHAAADAAPHGQTEAARARRREL